MAAADDNLMRNCSSELGLDSLVSVDIGSRFMKNLRLASQSLRSWAKTLCRAWLSTPPATGPGRRCPALSRHDLNVVDEVL